MLLDGLQTTRLADVTLWVGVLGRFWEDVKLRATSPPRAIGTRRLEICKQRSVGANLNKISHPHSRSERFTFASDKLFTLRSNASRWSYPALHVGLHRKPNLPYACRASARRLAPLQPCRNQGRYRTAGRVLQVRADRRVLLYATGGSNAARRAPAKRDRSVNKKIPASCYSILHSDAQRFWVLQGTIWGSVPKVLDRMSNAGKAQNIPQHEAKPIVKFIVPSQLEPLTALQKKQKNSGVVLLSHSQIYSTIAAGALNCRVREGNVCFCSAIDTGIYIPIIKKSSLKNFACKILFNL